MKDSYIKQAVDYGSNQGVEWVVLTNGAFWQIYKVSFGKPISQELVLEIDFLNLNPKKSADTEGLYLLTREGIAKSMLGEYHAQRVALSRYFIGATVLSEPVLDVIRRELRRISPDVKIDNEQIQEVLVQEVFKREVTEGEKAEDAQRKIARAANRSLRKATKDSSGDEVEEKPAKKSTDEIESTPSGQQ